MTRTIRYTKTLAEDDRRVLYGWSANPFGEPAFPVTWRPMDEHFIADVQGRPVSHVGLLHHTIRAGERPVVIAGVGGVITVPEAQKRGHAGALLEHATRFAFDTWRVDAGLLFCFDRMVPFYTRFGWHALRYPTIVDQPSGPIEMPMRTMVYPADRLGIFDATVTLNSLPW